MEIKLSVLFLRCSHFFKRKWKSFGILCIAAVLAVMDQKRRSKQAAIRFEHLFNNWSGSSEAKSFLKQLHFAINKQLERHDGVDLMAKFGAPDVDLALAGGGAKSLYAVGAYLALRHAGISVERASGTSCGAYLATLVVGNRYQVDDILEENLLGWGECSVQSMRQFKTLLLGKIWQFMCAALRKRLDGWLPQANTLFVSVTTVSQHGLLENVTGIFLSSEDLEQTICASMAIPFILCDGPFKAWRGQRAIDGGFTNNCPVDVFCKEFDTEWGTSCQHRVIVKADCSGISGMSLWRKWLYTVYADSEACSYLLLEGVKDMLEVLSSGKKQFNGITLYQPSQHGLNVDGKGNLQDITQRIS